MSQIIFSVTLTVLIENACLCLFKCRNYKIYLIGFIINIITNVSANLILIYLYNNHFIDEIDSYLLFVIFLEIIIILVEAFVYMIEIKKFKKAFLLSLILNVSSAVIGGIINLIKKL